MRGRLVEDQEPRLLGERARDDRALTLAAAQIVERQVREIEHAGRLHRLAGRRPIARALEIAAGIVRIAAHQHELADRERKLRQGPLRHDGDPAGQIHAGQSPDRHALETDLAGAGLEHPRQQSNQRRLARAVGPDHADDLARRDVERKLLDRKRSRSPLRRRWIREAHSAELCQHHSASTLEARARGAGVWGGVVRPRGTRSLLRGGWAPSGRATSVAPRRERVRRPLPHAPVPDGSRVGRASSGLGNRCWLGLGIRSHGRALWRERCDRRRIGGSRLQIR